MWKWRKTEPLGRFCDPSFFPSLRSPRLPRLQRRSSAPCVCSPLLESKLSQSQLDEGRPSVFKEAVAVGEKRAKKKKKKAARLGL